MANVKVAVRVRPLSKREHAEGSSIIVNVDDKIASIRNFKLDPWVESPGDSRQRSVEFTFDYCYWSVDSDSANFAPQELVYQDLGTSVLSGAIEGYNVCLFAYGQTGSGKTYTMMGTPAAIGLTPRICQGLFSRVDDYLEKPASCSIEVSFLEIYNERVRDLLKRCEGSKPYTLRVREHPEKGPYVQGLSQHLVSDYKQLVQLLEEGIANRITAATHVHDASSRSHAIFTIHYTQAILENNLPSEIVSKINLVDLAGSERADPNYSKDRITEGSNINKSLVTLGIVISTLAQNSQISSSSQSINSVMSEGDSGSHSSASSGNSRRQCYVPYRDSVLTWLLKDSLGGNSKTIMIATISPASTSYTETISTLRYAAHAKNIVNKPHVNEDANVKLIRELREEINRLKTMLRNLSPLSDENDEKDGSLTEMLLQNELKVDQLTKDWTDGWKDTKAIMEEYYVDINRGKTGVIVASQLPHLIAVDEDILSTGVFLYHLREGITKIGRIDAETEQDIVLQGPWVEKEHCIVHNVNSIVTLESIGGAQCIVNELDVVHSCRLSQGAIIILGKVHKFRFNHPTEAAKLRQRRTSNASLASSGSCEWLELDEDFNFSPPYVLSPLMKASFEQDGEKDEEMEINETRRQLKELHPCYQNKQQQYEEHRQKLRGLEVFYQEQIWQQQCYVEELRQHIQAKRLQTEQELKHDQEQLNMQTEENKQCLANEEKRLVCLEQQRRELGIQTDSASLTECGVQISSQMEEIPFIEQDRKQLVQLELLQRHSLNNAERIIRKKRVKYQLERIAEKHKLLEAKTILQHLETASLLSKKQYGCPVQGKMSTLLTDTNPNLENWNKSFPICSIPIRRHSLSVPFLSRKYLDSGDLVSHLNPCDFLKGKNSTTSIQMKKVHRTAQKSLSVGSLPKTAFPFRRKKNLKGRNKIISSLCDQSQIKHKGVEPEDVITLKQSTESRQGHSKILKLGRVQPEVQISHDSEMRVQKSDLMACSLDGQNIKDKLLELTDEKMRKDLSWEGSFLSTGKNLSPIRICERISPKQLFRSTSCCLVNQGQNLTKRASMVDLARVWKNMPSPCKAMKWNSDEMLNVNIAPDDPKGDWLGKEELSDTDSLYSVDSLSSAYVNAITEQLQKEESEEQQENCSESDDSEMSQDSLADKGANSVDAHCGNERCAGPCSSHSKTMHKLANRQQNIYVNSLTDIGKSSKLFRIDSPELTASDEMPAEVYWNLPRGEVDEKEMYQNAKGLIEEKECVETLKLKEQWLNLGSNTELKVVNFDKSTHMENLKPNKNDTDVSNMEMVSSGTSVLAISSGQTDCYKNAETELPEEPSTTWIPKFDPFQPNVMPNLHEATALTTWKECLTPQNENNQFMSEEKEESAQIQKIFLCPLENAEVTAQNSQCTDCKVPCVTGMISTAEVKTKYSLPNISVGISNALDSMYSAHQSCSPIESVQSSMSLRKCTDSGMEVTKGQYKNAEPDRSRRQSQHDQLRDGDYHQNYGKCGIASEGNASKLNFSSSIEKTSISGTKQFISPREELSCHRQSRDKTESQICSNSCCTPFSNSRSLTGLIAKPLLQLLEPNMLENCAVDVEKDPVTQRKSFNEENNDVGHSFSVENTFLAPLTQNKTKSDLESALQGMDCNIHSTLMKNGLRQSENSSLVQEGSRESPEQFVMLHHPGTRYAATNNSKGDPLPSYRMKEQFVAHKDLSRSDSKCTSSEMDSEIKVSEPSTLAGYLCMKDGAEGIQSITGDSRTQSIMPGILSDEKEHYTLKAQTIEKAMSPASSNSNVKDCLNCEGTRLFGAIQEVKHIVPAEGPNILNLPLSRQNVICFINEQATESAFESRLWNTFHQDSNIMVNSNNLPNKLNYSVSRSQLPQPLLGMTKQINKQGESQLEDSLSINMQRSAVPENVMRHWEIISPHITTPGFKTETDRSTLEKGGTVNQIINPAELGVQFTEENNTRVARLIDENTSTPDSLPCGLEVSQAASAGKGRASSAEHCSNQVKDNALLGGVPKTDSGLRVDSMERSVTMEGAGFFSKKSEVSAKVEAGCEGISKNALGRIGSGRKRCNEDAVCHQKKITCAELIRGDHVACSCPEKNRLEENKMMSCGAEQVVNSSEVGNFQMMLVQAGKLHVAETGADARTINIDLAESPETSALTDPHEIRAISRGRIGNEQHEMTPLSVDFKKLVSNPNDEARTFETGTELEGQGMCSDFNSSKYCGEQTCTKNTIENDRAIGGALRLRSLLSDCTCTETSIIAEASRVPFQNDLIGTGQAKQENSTIALKENKKFQPLHLEIMQNIVTDSNQSQSKCRCESHQKGGAGHLIQKSNQVSEIEGKMNVHNISDISFRADAMDLAYLQFEGVKCTADWRVSTDPARTINITGCVETKTENYNDIKGLAKSKKSMETGNGIEQNGCLSLNYNDERTEMGSSRTEERPLTHVGIENRSKQNHSHQMPSLRSGEDATSTEKRMGMCIENVQIKKDIVCDEKRMSFSWTETEHRHAIRNTCKLDKTCTFDNQEILDCQVSIDVGQRSECKHIDVLTQSHDLQLEDITAVRDELEHETDEHSSSKILKSIKSANCKRMSDHEEHKVSPEEFQVIKKSNSETFQNMEVFESVWCQGSTDQHEASLATALLGVAEHSLGVQECSQMERLENSGAKDLRAYSSSPACGTMADSRSENDANTVTFNPQDSPVEHLPLRVRQNCRLCKEIILLPELAENRAVTDDYMCSKDFVLLQHSEQCPSQPEENPHNTGVSQPNKNAVERKGTYGSEEAAPSCFVLRASSEVTGGDCQINQPVSSKEKHSKPESSDNVLPSQDTVLKEVIGGHVMWCNPNGTAVLESDFQKDQQAIKQFIDSDQAKFGPQQLRKTGIDMPVHMKQKSLAENMNSAENIANLDAVAATCKRPTLLHNQNTGILASNLNIDPSPQTFQGDPITDNIAVSENILITRNLLPQNKVFQNPTEFQNSLQDISGSHVSRKSQAASGLFDHQYEELDVTRGASSRAVLLKKEKQIQSANGIYARKATVQTTSVKDDIKTAIVPRLAGLSTLKSSSGAELLKASRDTNNQAVIQQRYLQFVQKQPPGTTGSFASYLLKANDKCSDAQFSVNTLIAQSFTGSPCQVELCCRRKDDLIERDVVGLGLTDQSSNLSVKSDKLMATPLIQIGEESVAVELMTLSKTITSDVHHNDKVDSTNQDLIRKAENGIEDCEGPQARLKEGLTNFEERSSDKNQGILVDIKENKSKFPIMTHKNKCTDFPPSVQEIQEQEKPRLLQHTQNLTTAEHKLGNESIFQRKDLSNTHFTLEVTETHLKMSSEIDLSVTQTDGNDLNANTHEEDAESFQECKQISELGSQSHETNAFTKMDGISTDSSVHSDSCCHACSGWTSVAQVNEFNAEGLWSSGSECSNSSGRRYATKVMSEPRKKLHRLKRIKPRPIVKEAQDSSSSSEETDIEFLSLNELRNRQCRRGINRSYLNVCKCKDSVNTTVTNLGNCVLNLKSETSDSPLSQRLSPPVVQMSSSSINLRMEDSIGHCLVKPSDGLTPRAASSSPHEEEIVDQTKHEAKDVGRTYESKWKNVRKRVPGSADPHGAACTETVHSPINLPDKQGQRNQSNKQESDDCTSLVNDNNLNNCAEGKPTAKEFLEVRFTCSDVNPYIHHQCNRSGAISWKQCTLENACSMRCSNGNIGSNTRCCHCNAHYATAGVITNTLNKMNDIQEGNFATLYPENDDFGGNTSVMSRDPQIVPSTTQSSQLRTSNSEMENTRQQVDKTMLLYRRDLESSVKLVVSDGSAKLSCDKEAQTPCGMRHQRLSTLPMCSSARHRQTQTPVQTYTSQSPQLSMGNLSIHLPKFLHDTAELLENIPPNQDHSDQILPTIQNACKLKEVRTADDGTQTATDVATQTELLPQIIENCSKEIQSKEVQRPPEVNVIVKVFGSDVNVNQELTNPLQEQKQNCSESDPDVHHPVLSHSIYCCSSSENGNSSFRTSSPILLPAQKLIANSSQTASPSPGLSPVTVSSQVSGCSDQMQSRNARSLEISKMKTSDPKLYEDREVKQFAQVCEAKISTNVNSVVLIDRASSPIKTLEAGLRNHRSCSKSFLCLQDVETSALQFTGYQQRKPSPTSWYGSDEKQQSKINFTQIKSEAEPVLETKDDRSLLHSNEQSKFTSQGLPVLVKPENKADLSRDLHTEAASLSFAIAEPCNISTSVDKSNLLKVKELPSHEVKELLSWNKGIEPHLPFPKVQLLNASKPDGRRQENAFAFQPSCEYSPLDSFPPAQINDNTVWPSRRIFRRSPSMSSIQHHPFSKDGVDFQEEKANTLHNQTRWHSNSMNPYNSQSRNSLVSEATSEFATEDAQSLVSGECRTELLLNEYPSITGCGSSPASGSRVQAESCRGPEDLPLHNKFQNWSGVHYKPLSTPSLSTSTNSHSQTEQDRKQTSSGISETVGLKSEDHKGRWKEIESLREERAQILSGLNLELDQHQLTVELAEAKLNYGQGETDALLRIFQSGAADDQHTCIRQQLYDRHMKTLEILKKERDERIQKFRRTRSLSPEKHLTLHHQKHSTTFHHVQDLPSKYRTSLQRLRHDIVEITRTRAVAKAPQETPSEIESLLRDYQKAREETKAEIAKARDKLRARAEKEKCRLQQEMFLMLLKEEERMRKVMSSSFYTGSNLSLSSNPTSGYSSSNTASPDINPQTKNKSSTDAVLGTRGCTACGNSETEVTKVVLHSDTSCPLAHSISGRITQDCSHPTSTCLKKYQDLAALAVASVTSEITVAFVNHPGNLLTGKAAAGWRYQGTEKGVLTFYKQYTSSTKHGFMGIGVIEKPLHSVWCMVKDNSKRQLYDKTLKTVKIHQQLGHGIELVYFVIDTSICCLNQPRDFCCISVEAKRNQQYVLAVQSIYEESMPRPVKEMVRGEMLPSGWIVQPDHHNGKEITRLTYLTQVDLGAPALPPRLLESFAKQHPLCIANLANLLS
ncbi:stAR-related lipid transfer protein 9-like isoform X2 [Narcine bancroftii]|uniref:stAR-related lipid transfer protein 9-like isoform X2 n=1 Tax=Narcine bancroftii TaxID=1343680 RepID=UPI003831D985